jgi:cytoplasmic tRNA 2-thiolation protein 2
MVHLLSQCCGNDARKKVLMSAVLLHIDESEITGNIPNIDHFKETATRYNFPVYVARLGQLFYGGALTRIEEWTATNPQKRDARVAELFDTCNGGTAKQDLLQQLRMSMVQHVAHELNCSSILIGTSANRAATLLIANTCLGRGMTIPEAPAPTCNKPFHQPMRDFLLKELTLYNRYTRVESTFTPNFATMRNAKTSIQQLSEAFVAGLQSDYPHTVHTILKSADKLVLPDQLGPVDICGLCSAPVLLSKVDAPIVHTNRTTCYGCKRLLQDCTTNIDTSTPQKPFPLSLVQEFILPYTDG